MLPAYHIWFLFYWSFGPKAATSRSLASHGRPVEVASRWFELDASSGCLPAQSAWAAEGGRFNGCRQDHVVWNHAQVGLGNPMYVVNWTQIWVRYSLTLTPISIPTRSTETLARRWRRRQGQLWQLRLSDRSRGRPLAAIRGKQVLDVVDHRRYRPLIYAF